MSILNSENTVNNKFINLLSADNKTIKQERAIRLANEIEAEVDTLITEKKKALNTIKSQIADLCDLSPSNSYSLRPGSDKFKPEDWTRQLFNAKCQLRIAEIEYEEATKIKTEWFTTPITPEVKG